jgi:hypothetical protein
MRPTPYVASLRIYEPLTAFSKEDQSRWSQILVSTPTGRDEQQRALRRTIVTEPPALKLDGAHVLEIDEKRYIAPWSTAARCWAALDDFKSSLPVTLSKFFLPHLQIDFVEAMMMVPTQYFEPRFQMPNKDVYLPIMQW